MSIRKFNVAIISLALATTLGLSSCCVFKCSKNKSAVIETGTWKLESMEGNNDKNAFADGDSFTIEFQKGQDKISGKAACNRFFGSYALKENGTIKINPGGTTMMACPNMNLEQPYFAMLDKADKYEIKGDVLNLFNGNTNIATFKMVIDMHNAENALDYIGIYQGITPAADCPGIKTTVTLNKNNTYSLKMEYLERNTVVNEAGKFELKGNILTLISKKGTPSLYKVGENKLIMLDREGNQIDGPLANSYILPKK